MKIICVPPRRCHKIRPPAAITELMEFKCGPWISIISERSCQDVIWRNRPLNMPFQPYPQTIFHCGIGSNCMGLAIRLVTHSYCVLIITNKLELPIFLIKQAFCTPLRSCYCFDVLIHNSRGAKYNEGIQQTINRTFSIIICVFFDVTHQQQWWLSIWKLCWAFLETLYCFFFWHCCV